MVLSELRNKDLKECEVELLDGAVDVFVVVSGLLQKLQHFGFDVEKALLRVPENNMSKFLWLFHHKIQIGMLHRGWKQSIIISIIVLLFG